MKKIILVFFMIFNCSHNMGNFKEYSIVAPSNLIPIGSGTVKGENCKWRFFTLRGWWSTSLAEATRDALTKAPGATGLKDAVISGHHESFFYACVEVEGTPVKEAGSETPSKSKEVPSKKKK